MLEARLRGAGMIIGPVEVLAAGGTAFTLGPTQIARAAVHARIHAGIAGRPITDRDLQLGAQAQNGTGLQRLARRVVPACRWSDLVLPAGVGDKLRELVIRARWRERVLDDWSLRRGSSRGEGVTALFCGPPGTGKTLAAEVVAGELGLDLYSINLATVVDKYVGETEKNLDRLFAQAERVSGVLLFDEADALFGKRSEVSATAEAKEVAATEYVAASMVESVLAEMTGDDVAAYASLATGYVTLCDLVGRWLAGETCDLTSAARTTPLG
ncbi:MAG: AAA family ATPase [Micromonosporaceae bacterium]|nr:AAA family ATPase [Micromonosporaceae bacterium]